MTHKRKLAEVVTDFPSSRLQHFAIEPQFAVIRECECYHAKKFVAGVVDNWPRLRTIRRVDLGNRVAKHGRWR